MFSTHEFETAFAKAKAAHSTISYELGELVMRKFVERWESERKKSAFLRESFGSLIRLTLNELRVNEKPKRQMYSALIGYYYSKHATYANRRKAAAKQPQKHAESPRRTPVQTVTGANGQLGWLI